MIALLLWLLAFWGGGETGFCDLPSRPFAAPDYNFEVIDRWPYGTGFCVLLDSDILYYTNGAVLQIGSVSSQGKVSWLSELVFPGLAYTMAKEASRLYVAVDDQGVAIVDVSTPTNPKQLSMFPAGGRVFGLAIRGDTLYAAVDSSGLAIFDCRIPTAPVLIGTIAGYTFRSLSLTGNLLYATDVDYGLRVLVIDDPSAPQVISGIKLSGQHYGLALDTLSKEAWVCSFYGGVQILDVSDPYHPNIKASLPMAGAWSVDLASKLAVVASWDDSVHVINRQNYSQSSSLGFDTLQVWPYGVTLKGSLGALAGFLGSWWIFDISNPPDLSITNGYARGGLTDVVTMHKGWIISGMQGSKLDFFPSTQTLNPALVITTQDWPRDFQVQNDTLYVAEGWAGLGMYDISDPTSGVDLIHRFTMVGIHVWEVTFDSGYSFLACGDSGLVGVDLSYPLNPQRVWKLEFDSRVLSLMMEGDTLYVGTQDRGVFLVDVASPDDPSVIASHPGSAPVADMLLERGFLYIAQTLEGVSVYDIASSPWVLKAKIPSGHASLSLAVEGDVLFIADGSAGIKAYDVTDPSSPHLVGSLNTGGEARDIESSSDTLVVADGYDGLIAVHFFNLGIEEPPQYFLGIQVRPNPFTSRLYFSQDVDATLYDVDGRKVARVRGRNYDASTLQPGVYFLKAQGWSTRLVKVRSP